MMHESILNYISVIDSVNIYQFYLSLLNILSIFEVIK